MSKKYLVQDINGASAIEFAIVAPMLLMLLCGITAYGIYFGAAHSVQQIAADAARTAVAGLDEEERKSLTANYIRNNADQYLFITTEKLKFSVFDSRSDPHQLTVEIAYDAKNLPIWNLVEGLPLPSKTISRTTTIRMGGI